jgi:hypothetical protein
MELNNYFISVGEPWDFKSQYGPYIIKGKIAKVISEKCLLFETNFHLDFENIKSNILVLTQRHEGIDFKNLVQNFITINGGLILPNFNIEASEKEIKENSKFIITGSLKKIIE